MLSQFVNFLGSLKVYDKICLTVHC